ncbi:MAG: protein kinase [Prevotella sp.]|nr:protein kinase [Prevotella sp.]
MKLKEGKYTIKEKLGQGGFGITYLATTLAEVKGKVNGKNKKMYAKAQVVVKEFFMSDYCKHGEDNQSVLVNSEGKTELVEAYRNKFKKEAWKLAKMDHPNIVKVTDVIEDENNTSYYVMSFLVGGTLYKLVRPDDKTVQPLSEGKAVKYVKQIADALGYMHKRMMCHFDVTPNNIMLDDEGNAVLIDFGMATNYSKNGKKMSTVRVGETVGYAPLEQHTATLDTFSPQTDIYALGATLYFLLTGHSPNAATFDMEAVLPKGPCGMSEHLWTVIQRCMQANPKDRPANIDAFMRLMDVDVNATRPMPPHLSPSRNKVALSIKKFLRDVVLWVVAGLSIWTVKHCDSDNTPTPTPPEPVVVDTVIVNNMQIKDSIGNLLYTYSGETLDSVPNGKGTAIYPDNDPDGRVKFEGYFKGGCKNDGTLTWSNGNKYDGAFVNDCLKEGKFTLKDGSYYQGTYEDNKPYNGKWYNKDGSFDADVVNGQ